MTDNNLIIAFNFYNCRMISEMSDDRPDVNYIETAHYIEINEDICPIATPPGNT